MSTEPTNKKPSAGAPKSEAQAKAAEKQGALKVQAPATKTSSVTSTGSIKVSD